METIGKGVSGSPSVSGVLEDEPQDSRRRSSRVAKSVTKIPKRASPYSAKQPAVKKKTMAVVVKKEAGAAFSCLSFQFCRNRITIVILPFMLNFQCYPD